MDHTDHKLEESLEMDAAEHDVIILQFLFPSRRNGISGSICCVAAVGLVKLVNVFDLQLVNFVCVRLRGRVVMARVAMD